MAQFFLILRVLAIALILLTLPGSNLWSQAIDTRQVLILNTYDGTGFAYDRVTATFKAELRRTFGEPIAFNEVDLDVRRSELGTRKKLVSQLLSNIYADTPPDIAFAVGGPAIRFWIDNRDLISGQTRLIAVVREGLLDPEDLRPGDIARFTQFSFSDVVDNLLRLRPGTSHVLMVLGNTPSERVIASQARQELGAYRGRIRFEYTNDMTVQEIEARLGELSEESAVFYAVFGLDANGVALPHDLGLSLTRSASAAPIFGAFDYELGQGIVGGRLIQLQRIGIDAAEAGAAILQGEPVREPWKMIELSVPVYDWRELERWDIDIERLPAGSEIRHRTPSLWDQYAAWIVFVTAVVVAQSLMIALLATQRRRRVAAELAQVKLSGKLITAYEDERRAIARELHDDLSQRLARLAIDAGVIRPDQNGDILDDELKNLRQELARVSEDVHDMSYRLHPSLVEELGISTALRTECQTVREYTDVSIKEHIGETHGRIPNKAALCAFRVAQEALSNAVRHAGADSIEIVFKQEGGALELEVTDDGRGFDRARSLKTGSLGLSSMRERIRLLDGTLSIRSAPGKGTTVSAVVPLTGDNQ